MTFTNFTNFNEVDVIQITSCKNCLHEIAVLSTGEVTHFWEQHVPFHGQGVATRCGFKVVFSSKSVILDKHNEFEVKKQGNVMVLQCPCAKPEIQ